MSDTPRTDAQASTPLTADGWAVVYERMRDHARQLERELAQAEYIGNDLAHELADARLLARDAYAHNDALKDAIDSYRRLLGHAATTYAKFDFKAPVLLTDGAVTHTLQDLPRALGVSRMGDNDKAILVHFSRRLTDDELRAFHDALAQPQSQAKDDAGSHVLPTDRGTT